MADTAALVVALSAQLTKFEKDMKDAVKIADVQTKNIENSFSQLNKSIDNQMSSIAQNAAGRLGGLGTVLSSIGPIGLTVAAAVGALALGLDFVTSKVDAFAQKAREMKETAETLGVSTEAIKALGITGQQVGLDFEQTERATRKLAISVQDLREKGSGPLFDVLLKINPALIHQVAAAKDVTQAIDILSAAYKELNKQQQLQLSSALGGVRNLGIGRILGALPEGGLTQRAQEQLDKGFSPELIERVAKLRQEIEAIQKRTDTIWGTAFAEPVLSSSKLLAIFWQAIAEGVTNTKNNVPTWLLNFLESATRGVEKARQAGLGPVRPGAPAPTQGAVPDIIGPVGPAFDKAAAAQDKYNQTLISDLNTMKKWTAVVADALTQAEQLTQKKLELAVAQRTEGVSSEQAARALAEYELKAREANVAIKERLGIASLAEIQGAKLARVDADATKFALSAAEAERGRAKKLLDSQKAYEAMLVSASKTPELTRFALDAANGFKQFDTFVTSAFSGFESALGNVANGTTKLADAFKTMANSIISDLVRIAIRMSVTGPLAGALSGLFGGAGGLSANSSVAALTGVQNTAGWSTDRFLGRQGGGSVSSGRGYIVGEHGAELFVPSSAGQIVPGSVQRGGAGATTVEINNYTAADTETKQTQQQGPNGERIVIDIIKKAQARGEFDSVNRGRFAMRPAKVR